MAVGKTTPAALSSLIDVATFYRGFDVARTYQEQLEERIRAMHGDPRWIVNILVNLSRAREPEELKALYDSLLTLLGSKVPILPETYCYALVVLGRSDVFIRLLEASREFIPDSPVRDFALGLLYRRVNKNEAALQCYERYLARFPNEYRAAYNASLSSVALGRPDEAAAYALRARDARPDHLANGMRQITVPRLNPKSAEVVSSDEYEELGIQEQAAGKWERALCYFVAALSMRPGLGSASIERRIREIVNAQGKTHLLVCPIFDHALGHLVHETDYIVRLSQTHHRDTLYLLVGTPQPANQTVVDLFARVVPVVQSNELYCLVTELAPNIVRRNVQNQFQPQELYLESGPAVSFSEEELAAGWTRLKRWGIERERDWYVCIYARDEGDRWGDPESRYRNADIETYDPAIGSILARGGYVVRVGSWAAKPLRSTDPRVIDYAFDGTSDFFDIFLISQAKFVIGMPSGIFDTCLLFDTPQIGVNCPMKTRLHGKKTLWMPKKLWHIADQRYCSFKEFDRLTSDMYTGGLDWADLFTLSGIARAGFELRDNTPEEIREITEEMMARLLDARWDEFEDQPILQRYYEVQKSAMFMGDLRMPIGIDFLRRHQEMFFD